MNQLWEGNILGVHPPKYLGIMTDPPTAPPWLQVNTTSRIQSRWWDYFIPTIITTFSFTEPRWQVSKNSSFISMFDTHRNIDTAVSAWPPCMCDIGTMVSTLTLKGPPLLFSKNFKKQVRVSYRSEGPRLRGCYSTCSLQQAAAAPVHAMPQVSEVILSSFKSTTWNKLC